MASVQKNEAVVLRSVNDMSIEEYPFPRIGPHDCLIQMKAVGICGSDVHYWQHGRIGEYILQEPMVIGHESAGVVVAVGTNVTSLKAGDRVALEPGVPCSRCQFCIADKYNLCPDIEFFATPPIHGSLARFVRHPARFCFRLPDSMTLEEGALCEPLSVGVYACEQKVRVRPGQTICVFGSGPIGIICALVAKSMGASTVIVCDILDGRLQLASKCVDGIVTLNSQGMCAQDLATRLCELNGGEKVDACVDCCGAEPAVQAAILATQNGGVVCLVGMGCAHMNLPILNASSREVEIQGVFRYRHTYPKCIELMHSKQIDACKLITHRFAFTSQSVIEAFETCKRGQGLDGTPSVKCMINIDSTVSARL